MKYANKIVFFTLALFMGAAHRQSCAMEAPELPQARTPAQIKAFRETLKEKILNLPHARETDPKVYSTLLEDISSHIQARENVDLGKTIIDLIKQKRIGESLLNVAEKNHQEKTMQWLAHMKLVDPQDRFFTAFYANDLDRAEFWLRHGANIHAKDPIARFSLLAQAAYSNNYSLAQLKFLLDHGADVNEKYCAGASQKDWCYNLTPLDHAISARAWDKVKLLQEYGAKPGE